MIIFKFWSLIDLREFKAYQTSVTTVNLVSWPFFLLSWVLTPDLGVCLPAELLLLTDPSLLVRLAELREAYLATLIGVSGVFSSLSYFSTTGFFFLTSSSSATYSSSEESSTAFIYFLQMYIKWKFFLSSFLNFTSLMFYPTPGFWS